MHTHSLNPFTHFFLCFLPPLPLSLLSCFFLSLTFFNIFPEAGISQCYMLGITQEPNSPPPWDVISSDRRNRNEVGTPVTADLLVVAEKNTWGGAGSGRGKNASDQALLWWSGKASLKKWLLHQGESKDPCEPCLWQEGVFTTGVIRAEAWPWAAPSRDASWRCPFLFLPSLQFILPSSSKLSLAQHHVTHRCDPRDDPTIIS